MVVTEQIEALEALGLSPVQFLVVPRLIAMVVILPLLTLIGDIVAIVGGMYLANKTAHISYGEFFLRYGRAALLTITSKECSKRYSSRHHRHHRLLSGSRRARGRSGCRKSDDGCGRYLDHPHFHYELRAFADLIRYERQMTNFAKLDAVTLKYGEKVVLQNCTLEVREHAITCLIGLSGAG